MAVIKLHYDGNVSRCFRRSTVTPKRHLRNIRSPASNTPNDFHFPPSELTPQSPCSLYSPTSTSSRPNKEEELYYVLEIERFERARRYNIGTVAGWLPLQRLWCRLKPTVISRYGSKLTYDEPLYWKKQRNYERVCCFCFVCFLWCLTLFGTVSNRTRSNRSKFRSAAACCFRSTRLFSPPPSHRRSPYSNR